MIRALAIDVAVLRKMLAYDPETGALTWLERPTDTFANAASARTWNARWAGKPAFACVSSCGYNRATLLGRVYYAHRVAWALSHSEWPLNIDHINGIRTDNRIANLRNVTRQENQRNMARPSNNASGVIGVCWATRPQKWLAYIRVSRRQIMLGAFENIEDAIKARKAAESEFGFHPNHGRAA